jgi:hypothetical protein
MVAVTDAAPSRPATISYSARPENLSLRERPYDIAFALFFAAFTVTSIISDMLPTLGVDISRPSSNPIVNSNYWYAHDTDPLFMHPPTWMRIATGLSAFVYMPFYILLVIALVRAWNWIQLPSVIYATMIITLTGIVIFGVELWGEPEWVTPRPGKFLAFNLPYVIVPLLLLIRMRKPDPFRRLF